MPPGSGQGPSVIQQPVDMSPLTARLDAILATLGEMRQNGKPAGPMQEIPAAESNESIAAKAGEKAAADVLEKSGLLGRVKDRVESTIGWPHILGGAGLGLGGIALIAVAALALVRRDVRQYVETGGEDKLAIQRGAALIPGRIGDIIEEAANRGAERAASVYRRFHPDVAPPAPPSAPAA